MADRSTLPGARFRDPRLDLSRFLLQQGLNTGPVQHPVQGIARLAQALAGSAIQNRVADQENEAVNALLRGASAKPFVNPDTGEVAPNQNVGGSAGALTALSRLEGNPAASRLARQLSLQGIDRQQQRADIQDQRNFQRELAEQAFQRQKELLETRLSNTSTTMQKNFDAAKRDGFPGTFTDFIAETRKTIERTPTGFQRTVGGLETIPGGPADPAVQAAQKAAEEQAKLDVERKAARPKAQNALSAFERQTQNVTATIDKAIEQASGTLMTGLGANLAGVAGTPQFDLAQTLNTIKANVGFDRLQQMRENSPTGGALGQVSENENALLQAVEGSLVQGQSQEQLIANLQNIKRLREVVLQERRAAFEADFGDLGTPQESSRLPEGVTNEDIEETMRANNMTRQQVIEELRRRRGGP